MSQGADDLTAHLWPDRFRSGLRVFQCWLGAYPFTQLGLFLTILALAALPGQTMIANMERVGITPGFAFLWRPANFEIGESPRHPGRLSQYGDGVAGGLRARDDVGEPARDCPALDQSASEGSGPDTCRGHSQYAAAAATVLLDCHHSRAARRQGCVQSAAGGIAVQPGRLPACASVRDGKRRWFSPRLPVSSSCISG